MRCRSVITQHSITIKLDVEIHLVFRAEKENWMIGIRLWIRMCLGMMGRGLGDTFGEGERVGCE